MSQVKHTQTKQWFHPSSVWGTLGNVCPRPSSLSRASIARPVPVSARAQPTPPSPTRNLNLSTSWRSGPRQCSPPPNSQSASWCSFAPCFAKPPKKCGSVYRRGKTQINKIHDLVLGIFIFSDHTPAHASQKAISPKRLTAFFQLD